MLAFADSKQVVDTARPKLAKNCKNCSDLPCGSWLDLFIVDSWIMGWPSDAKQLANDEDLLTKSVASQRVTV